MKMNLSKNKRGIVLGLFDGVHVGHRELIHALVQNCAYENIIPAVFTFRVHPSKVVGNANGAEREQEQEREREREREQKQERGQGQERGQEQEQAQEREWKQEREVLTDNKSKEELFSELGIQEIIYEEFTKEFAAIAPLDFLDKYLDEKLNAQLIVVGYDYKFGHNRSGDVNLLQKWGNKKNIKIIVVEPVSLMGEICSSSLIRKYIKEGEMDIAAKLLGRPYFLEGKVIKGKKLGTKISFPTANFEPCPEVCLPPDGIYATRIQVDNRVYDGVTNIGVCPTVSSANDKILVETYIPDVNIQLYEKNVRVYVLEKIRDEQKFDTIEELAESIEKDVENAKELHLNRGDYHLLWRKDDIKLMGLKTSNFSTIIARIDIALPLTLTHASGYNLLSGVLTTSSGSFPSKKLLINETENLYGAILDSQTSISGNMLEISFSIDGLKSWPGDDYTFNDGMKLLVDIMTNPDFDDEGDFKKQILESEKLNLISEIRGRENNKMRHALDRAIEMYTEGTPYGIRSFGDENVIKDFTGEELKNIYNEMFKTGYVTGSLGGNYDEEDVAFFIKTLDEMFRNNKPEKRIFPGGWPLVYRRNPEYKENTEIKELDQAKIILLFQKNTDEYLSRTAADLLLNELFGGSPDSLLFREVREEMGLAYSVFSANMSNLNCIIAGAGVANNRVKEASDEIEKQFLNIIDGNYDDALLVSAKKSLINNLLRISDVLKDLLENSYMKDSRGRNLSTENLVYEINNFSKEEISGVASKYIMAVKYVLKGK